MSPKNFIILLRRFRLRIVGHVRGTINVHKTEIWPTSGGSTENLVVALECSMGCVDKSTREVAFDRRAVLRNSVEDI